MYERIRIHKGGHKGLYVVLTTSCLLLTVLTTCLQEVIRSSSCDMGLTTARGRVKLKKRISQLVVQFHYRSLNDS